MEADTSPLVCFGDRSSDIFVLRVPKPEKGDKIQCMALKAGETAGSRGADTLFLVLLLNLKSKGPRCKVLAPQLLLRAQD